MTWRRLASGGKIWRWLGAGKSGGGRGGRGDYGILVCAVFETVIQLAAVGNRPNAKKLRIAANLCNEREIRGK